MTIAMLAYILPSFIALLFIVAWALTHPKRIQEPDRVPQRTIALKLFNEMVGSDGKKSRYTFIDRDGDGQYVAGTLNMEAGLPESTVLWLVVE